MQAEAGQHDQVDQHGCDQVGMPEKEQQRQRDDRAEGRGRLPDQA